jgi:hypothetical protein
MNYPPTPFHEAHAVAPKTEAGLRPGGGFWSAQRSEGQRRRTSFTTPAHAERPSVQYNPKGQAMTDDRNAIAAMLRDHAIGLCSDLVSREFAPGMETGLGACGEFAFSHSRPTHYMAEEIVDIWHGRKVFSARRAKGRSDWQITTFKRGDWEVGFMLADNPTEAPSRVA